MKRTKSKKLLILFMTLVMVFTSASSGMTAFATETPVIGTVTDPSWKEYSSATAQWSAVEGANYYKLKVYVYDADVLLGSCEAGTSSTEVDVQQEIHKIYNEAKSSAVVVQVAYTVTSTYVLDEKWSYGEESAMSEKISYYFADRLKFTTPQNVQIDKNYVVSWDISENDHLAINYYVKVAVKRPNSSSFSSSSVYSFAVNKDPDAVGTRYMADLYNILKNTYYQHSNPEGTKVKISVQTGYNNEKYIESDYSIESEEIELVFSDSRTKFTTPQNVQIDENYVVSWDISENDHIATNYYVRVAVKRPNSSSFSSSSVYSFAVNKDPDAVGTRYMADLYNILKNTYYQHSNPEGTKVKISVQTGYNNEKYIESGYSTESEEIELPFHRVVKDITLSPEKPVMCLGNSLYLGKTIFPIDAHYRTIDWTSDNTEIVSVDENGKITAKAIGTANITATIGDISATVPVTVYSVKSSTIFDEEEKKEVTDQAGNIIDDILNNENPDLSGTDIPEEDLEDIKESIQEGMERGDEFFTDLNWYEENFVKYRDNWGQIQKAARELNAQFAGAYNIEVEMYHKDKDGEKYHIGNIVELDNMITFTFDLPTGMKEIESGETKKFVLVRIHKNTIEPIDYTINGDGTFTARSDKYSDFIWLIVDEEGCAGGNHDLGDYFQTISPTCTVLGEEKRECSRCDYSETREISTIDHSYESVVTAPTCTAQGYTTYTCECGDSYIADYVDKLDHEYTSQITTPATHLATGNRTYTCSICGNSYTETIAKTSQHTYTASNVLAPACEKEGYTVYICECGDSYNGDIKSATGHDYEGDTCKTCGESKVENCSCNCHKSGFMGLIWKILRFFYKLFKTNPVCSCGVAHY